MALLGGLEPPAHDAAVVGNQQQPGLRHRGHGIQILRRYFRLPPQRVDVFYCTATERQRHVIIKQPGDAGKADKGFPRFLG
jgi:hypothetical protein